MEQFKLKISKWINGVWTTITKIFSRFEDALKESKLWLGIVKIYNNIGQLLFCDKKHGESYA
jgi:hypothetical protein